MIILLIICRCQDINLRKEYVELVESIKDSGGDVKIFSSLHVSGERKLNQLFKFQFILRYFYILNNNNNNFNNIVYRIRSTYWNSSYITFSYARIRG